MKISRAAHISAFKNHPRDILRDENHHYGIVLVHITHNTALNTTKHLQVARYKIFLNRQNSNFSLTDCLPHCLTDHSRKVRSQTKQRTVTIYATITHSPVGCSFWGSDECRPSAPCLFFFLQSGCLSSSSSNETISRR